MVLLSTEFWVVFQVCIILCLCLFCIYFAKISKSQGVEKKVDGTHVDEVINLIEPLLKEAESTARVFETQILEKRQLIKQLNEKLDSRIISLNLLLNRAEACLMNTTDFNADIDTAGIQKMILSLHKEGYNTTAISSELSLSEQEVDLVIELKEKFLAMGN